MYSKQKEQNVLEHFTLQKQDTKYKLKTLAEIFTMLE